jgi:hypothetical protein
MRAANVVSLSTAVFGIAGGGVLASIVGLATDPAHRQFWVGCFVACGVVAALSGIVALVQALADKEETDDLRERHKMIPLICMIVCGVGLVGFGTWYFWPPAKHATVAAATVVAAPQTLEGLFKSDFSASMRLDTDITTTLTPEAPHVPAVTPPTLKSAVLLDLTSHAESLAVYIPPTEYTLIMCKVIAVEADKWVNEANGKIKIKTGMAGQVQQIDQDWVFTRTVYVYHSSELTIHELSEATAEFQVRKLNVIFRGQDYLVVRMIGAEQH